MSRTHPAFSQTDHRPWPLPSQRPLLSQRWLNLLFIHWQVNETQLRAKIPEPLEIDRYDDKAWIAVVPFDMKGVTFNGLPAVRALSDFPEINVRTYVTYQGKPGVWFFSLDVPKQFAVWAARTFFHLPYRHAKVEVIEEAQAIHYKHKMPNASFEATYQPQSKKSFKVDTFEHWATERYCLYCQNKRGHLYRTEVHHPKWPLQYAILSIQENTLLKGWKLGAQHPSVLFSKHLDVVAYAPQKVFEASNNG